MAGTAALGPAAGTSGRRWGQVPGGDGRLAGMGWLPGADGEGGGSARWGRREGEVSVGRRGRKFKGWE
ncbi:hypothetical protein GUJ93_ZPchr0004g39600 [Zizania palustris]|uniref:Uncharacterized protein n=1 Tax=Zizania palustris TaxID=103762 RepID=A0A8J5V8F3_ZIZPA|nr:hypothetical protein GUJ93_ZPchr0004g39600 [Zizania palustris]